MQKRITETLFLTACFLAAATLTWAGAVPYRTDNIEYRFPEDAGVINVRDFGAKGDGVADDTSAIQEAIRIVLRGSYRNPNFIYFPEGIYLISDHLRARVTDAPDGEGGWSDGWRPGMILVGESRERTVIKLKDNAPGYSDPDNPKAMVIYGSTGHGAGHDARIGGWGNEAFQNNMMNMTVDTGRGNPGAIGVKFLASNRGTMEEVTVRSGDPEGRGHTGLSMTRPWPGPGLIKNVWIDGFDHGIRQHSMDCSMTFEHITLSNQRVAGVLGTSHPFMSIRGLVSHNAVPPVIIEGGNAIISILDSRFVHTGENAPPPAIQATGYLTLKGVEFEGYPVAAAGTNQSQPINEEVNLRNRNGRGRIELFSSRQPFRLHDGPVAVPDLEVKETPIFHHTDFDKWANARNFMAGSRTAGIQEAIDSGAEIVYLPNGSYPIAETIVIRGNVRKIMGLEARLETARGRERPNPTIRFDGTDHGEPVILEHVIQGVVEHNSDQTLVIRKCDLTYRNTPRGSGDIFLEDGMFGRPKILYPQRMWARQYNSEFGSTPQIEVHGGQAWILGMKVEGWPSAIHNEGGIVECYGLYTMLGSGDQRHVVDAFVVNREGWMAVPFRVGGQGNYRVKADDTWNGERKREENWQREYPLTILGQSFDPVEHRPSAPAAARGRALSNREVELQWRKSEHAGPIALRGYRIERNGQHVATVDPDQTSFTDQGLSELTEYKYAVRAVNLRGGASESIEVVVATPADTTPPQLTEIEVCPHDASVLMLDFDQPLASNTAVETANYRLTPGGEIINARLNHEGNRVILKFAEPLRDADEYSLATRNLRDRSRAGNELANPRQEFTSWRRGEGLLAEFWNGDSFEGEPVYTRTQSRIDHWWGGGSPAPGVEPRNFRVRWSGYLRPKVSGRYRFHTGIRSGGRIFIDGELFHNQWPAPEHEWWHSSWIDLEAGRRYRIVFEVRAAGHAGARLKWEGAVPNQFIDEEYLFLPDDQW